MISDYTQTLSFLQHEHCPYMIATDATLYSAGLHHLLVVNWSYCTFKFYLLIINVLARLILYIVLGEMNVWCKTE